MPSNLPAPNSSTSRCFRGSFPNGAVRSIREIPAQSLQRLAHELAIAAGPWGDGAFGERLRLVGHDAPGSKSIIAPRPWHSAQAPVRRVEGKGPRRHLGHAQAAVDTGQAPREQPIALVEGVDDDDVVGQVQRDVDRFRSGVAPRRRG
jgi:hypothetical protein